MRLSVAFGSTTGRLGTARTLRVAPILFRPQLAVNTHGSALFAWVEVVRSASGTRHIVRIAERLSSSASHPPVALPGRGYVQGLAVAVGDRGDAVAAVVREGRLLARVRRPGHPWGLFSQLARAATGSKTTWQLSAAIDGRGNVRVVWRRHEFSRPGVPGRLALQDAVMAAGSARFRRAETIEPDGAGEPVLRLTSAGWTLAYMHQTPDGPRPALRLSSPAGT